MRRAALIYMVSKLQPYAIAYLTTTVELNGFRKSYTGYPVSNSSSNLNVTTKTTFGCLRFCSLLQNCSVVSYENVNGTCVVSDTMQATSDSDHPDETIATYIKHGSGTLYLLDLVSRNFDHARVMMYVSSIVENKAPKTWYKYIDDIIPKICKVDNCTMRGGQLIYIKSESMRVAAKQFIQQFGNPTAAWIGASRSSADNMFYWFDGTLVNGLWGPGQPDGRIGEEECVELKPFHDYHLNNVDCNTLLQNVCEIIF